MKKTYSKDLITPITSYQKHYSLTDLDGPDRDFKRIQLERMRKFILLLEHYEITGSGENLATKLVWSLINDHVPGFQLEGAKRKAGRPKTWTREKKLELVLDVISELLDGATTDAEALRRLVQKGKVSEVPKRADSAKHRLDEARQDNVVAAYEIIIMRELRTHSFDEVRQIVEIFRENFTNIEDQ